MNNNPLPRTVSMQIERIDDKICMGIVDIKNGYHLDWETFPQKCVNTFDKMKRSIEKYWTHLEDHGVI